MIPKILTGSNGAAPGSAVPTAIPPTTDNGGGGRAASFAAIKNKRRGVKPGTKRGPYDKGDARSVSTGGDIAPAPPVAAPIFTPEHTKLIVRMPFNLAVAKTGWSGWELSADELETLAAPLAVTLNAFIPSKVDPKWISLSLFSLALLSITGEKSVMYRAAVAERDRVQTPKPTPEPAAAPATTEGAQ